MTSELHEKAVNRKIKPNSDCILLVYFYKPAALNNCRLSTFDGLYDSDCFYAVIA